MLKTNYYSVALINYTFFSTLKYYRFFFVTLMVSSGLTDLVFISTAAYHKNYTEKYKSHQQFEHLPSYFTLI